MTGSSVPPASVILAAFQAKLLITPDETIRGVTILSIIVIRIYRMPQLILIVIRMVVDFNWRDHAHRTRITQPGRRCFRRHDARLGYARGPRAFLQRGRHRSRRLPGARTVGGLGDGRRRYAAHSADDQRRDRSDAGDDVARQTSR